jgi:hypothetical protein
MFTTNELIFLDMVLEQYEPLGVEPHEQAIELRQRIASMLPKPNVPQRTYYVTASIGGREVASYVCVGEASRDIQVQGYRDQYPLAEVVAIPVCSSCWEESILVTFGGELLCKLCAS